MQKADIHVQNVKCRGCSSNIISHLKSIEGIQNVHVDVENQLIEIEFYDTSVIGHAKIKLKELGYPAYDNDNTIKDKANSYVSCLIGRVQNVTKPSLG